MAESKLDQIVKGAPSSTVKAPTPSIPPPQAPSDPLSTLPSSPPQIYLNLLILEASLRSQYLTLRARRRQHTFFLFLLAAWIACFFYALFLRPREDGSGVGGSVYWVVETAEKVALMGGVVTGILVWGTGQWERGIRWPRRWVGVANRGLRGINSKLVVIKGPWWRELFSTLSILFPYSSFFQSQGSSYHYVSHVQDQPKRSNHLRTNSSLSQPSHTTTTQEEDLAPGGDYVKLLLLPKPFSPAFRENWEAFRSDYWETENERRAQLLHKLRQREREVAKREGGWLWWTGWRGWKRAKSVRSSGSDVEKSHHQHHQHRTHLDAKTSRPSSMYRSGSQSHNSSRSTTPTHELDEKPLGDRNRRSSTASNSSRTSVYLDKEQQQPPQQQQQQQQQQQLQHQSSKRRSKTGGSSSSNTRGSDKTSGRTRERSSNRGRRASGTNDACGCFETDDSRRGPVSSYPPREQHAELVFW